MISSRFTEILNKKIYDRISMDNYTLETNDNLVVILIISMTVVIEGKERSNGGYFI